MILIEDVLEQVSMATAEAATTADAETECGIHKTAMTSFAVTIFGHCCRRHVAGQQVVSDVCVVHSCRSICSPCSNSSNANLLLRHVTPAQ